MRKSTVVRALVLPRLSYGISSKLLGILWGPVAVIVVIVGTTFGYIWSLIPITLGIMAHTILQWYFRKDHRFFDINSRFSKLASDYHPHSREVLPVGFERPNKFGRGLRI